MAAAAAVVSEQTKEMPVGRNTQRVPHGAAARAISVQASSSGTGIAAQPVDTRSRQPQVMPPVPVQQAAHINAAVSSTMTLQEGHQVQVIAPAQGPLSAAEATVSSTGPAHDLYNTNTAMAGHHATAATSTMELIDDGAGMLLVNSPWPPPPPPVTAAAATGDAAGASSNLPFSVHVMSAIQQQVEYYFSEENLARDNWLVSQMDEEGWIDLALLATFNRVRSLTTNLEELYHALSLSQQLQLQVVSWSPPIAKVRRKGSSSNTCTVSGSVSGSGRWQRTYM